MGIEPTTFEMLAQCSVNIVFIKQFQGLVSCIWVALNELDFVLSVSEVAVSFLFWISIFRRIHESGHP